MSDAQQSLPGLPATAGDPMKRDWRAFTVTLIAGTIAFAGLLGMHYMPEVYQKLTALTACGVCLLYTSPSPRDVEESRMPSSA